jgi:hypothetical protein
VTTGFFYNTTEDYFPDNDFFLDIDNLFGDISTCDNTANAPYIILYHLFNIILQTLLLANYLDLLFVYYLLGSMTSLINVLLVMFYLLFLWIKSCEKFLIYPTA